MGWERKRGKLVELNRLLRGDRTTSFKLQLGESARLRGVRFVITLDADTHLPLGTAQRLIGLLAHPLNRAELDARSGRVVAGYTVVQPRIEASPAPRAESWFSRTFAGDTALDIYTRAVSDVYQDLLPADIYEGAASSGRGGWTWYTGAAAWTWRLGVEAILGLCREGTGYRFDPCIPPDWPGFEASVRVGQSELRIVVDNSDGTGHGVLELKVDGVRVDSRLVEIDPHLKGRREVRILLGDARGSVSRSSRSAGAA
jgi:hypothetical protein